MKKFKEMLKKRKCNTRIIVWIFVLILSLVVFVLSIVSGKLENATFSIVPLIVALMEILRDEENFRKQKILQENDYNFNLAFSSELAKQTVLKQSAFGEEYLACVDEFLQHFWTNGTDHDEFLKYAHKLTIIQRKYSLWLSDDVESFLNEFEKIIRWIGSKEGLLPHLPVGENRSKVIGEISKKIEKIYKEKVPETEESFHRNEIVKKIKNMIGVSHVINKKKLFNS